MSIVSKLVKKLDATDIIRFTEKDNFNEVATWIHTGMPEVEFEMGILGFPPGVIEIAGKSQSGKTTISLMCMYNFQRKNKDGIVIILSSENRDNKQYAQKLNINTDDIIIIKSKFVEDLFYKLKMTVDEIEELWKSEGLAGKPKILIVWDSIGGTLSRSEAEVFEENVAKIKKGIAKGDDHIDMAHAQPAAFAKNAKAMVKSMLGELYEKGYSLIGINHTGEKIGFGQKGRKSFGGEWVEYLPTIRIQTVVIKTIELDKVDVGQITRVKVIKNDFGGRKECDIEILFGYGIVLSESDIEYACKKGIINKAKTGKEGKTIRFEFLNGKLGWVTKREFYTNYFNGSPLLRVLHSKVAEARHKDVLAARNNENEEE